MELLRSYRGAVVGPSSKERPKNYCCAEFLVWSGAEAIAVSTSLAPHSAMLSCWSPRLSCWSLNKVNDSFSCFLMENLKPHVGFSHEGGVFGTALSLFLNSCRAVHHHLHALRGRVISTQVPEDCLCSPCYLCLREVYLKTICH